MWTLDPKKESKKVKAEKALALDFWLSTIGSQLFADLGKYDVLIIGFFHNPTFQDIKQDETKTTQ